MSVIVAVKDRENNSVWLGADSYGADTSQWLVAHRSDSKIFTRELPVQSEVNDGYFRIGFGCTSSYRMIQLLQYELVIPKWDGGAVNDETAMNWMVRSLIPAVRKLFKDEGFTTIDKNSESGGQFIVTFKGRVFEVQGDFQVVNYLGQEYAAIGCGSQVAIGALYAARKLNVLTTQQLCDIAVKAAIEHSAFCNGHVDTFFVK